LILGYAAHDEVWSEGFWCDSTPIEEGDQIEDAAYDRELNRFRLLGFYYWHETNKTSEPHNLYQVAIPFWFTTCISALFSIWVWRVSGQPNARLAFPVIVRRKVKNEFDSGASEQLQ
jgi:hypothetical protein